MRQRPVQRERQHKVSGAVQDIVRDTCTPVGKGRIEPAGDQVGDGAQGPEGQPESAGDHGPEESGIHLSEG